MSMTDKIRNIVEDVSTEDQEIEQPTEDNSEEVVEELESTESEVSEEAEEVDENEDISIAESSCVTQQPPAYNLLKS